MHYEVDPSFALVTPSQIVTDVWTSKYQWEDEDWEGMCVRVGNAVFAKDPDTFQRDNAIEAMLAKVWMPAGRILAGAGTPKRVTLLNCFVNGDLEDDMASIAQGIGNIMLTQQQGGGIGTDFTPLRPAGAILRRTGAVASGPGPFIDTWDSACATIRSAGDRRGAMMGTLLCTHPFLLEFITAKNTPGRWTNFNVSVLITDAFMGAVDEDEEWSLYHACPPAFDRPSELTQLDFVDDETGEKQYVYSVHRARDIWDMIIENTYKYAEPGVIFIDRVNDLNNLNYCEHIQCTNPCGEQPLPAHGCCDLGAVLDSRCVKNPFTEDAYFDWELLRAATRVGVRFLDNVIDVTNYPLPEQRDEQLAKRRIGLGQSGLADAMHMLGMRYGSVRSIEFAEKVSREIAIEAYRTSALLAKEKGPFPLYNGDAILEQPFIKKLPEDVQELIRAHGLRNGVLLTIAPTGTTSIAYGNGSSGLEPVFAHSMHRRVRKNNSDHEWDEYDEIAWGAKLWLTIQGQRLPYESVTLDDLPSYMNVCDDVRVHEHIRIQEVCQKWVDASISKTINVPESISFEEFKGVYQLAYESGCKGCTTYRPSDVRGSILSTPVSPGSESERGHVLDQVVHAPTRPEVVTGRTVKLRWPGLKSALYLTLNEVDGKPYELFINSKDQSHMEWSMALTVLMSMALRQGITMEQIAEEFLQVQALEGGWADNGSGKSQYWPSLVAYLGHKLSQLNQECSVTPLVPVTQVQREEQTYPTEADIQEETRLLKGMQCVDCHQYSVIMQAGCPTCTNCGWSKCS